MWLTATMQPPVAGIFSPSIQVRDELGMSSGFKIVAPTRNVHGLGPR